MKQTRTKTQYKRPENYGQYYRINFAFSIVSFVSLWRKDMSLLKNMEVDSIVWATSEDLHFFCQISQKNLPIDTNAINTN